MHVGHLYIGSSTSFQQILPDSVPSWSPPDIFSLPRNSFNAIVLFYVAKIFHHFFFVVVEFVFKSQPSLIFSSLILINRRHPQFFSGIFLFNGIDFVFGGGIQCLFSKIPFVKIQLLNSFNLFGRFRRQVIHELFFKF